MRRWMPLPPGGDRTRAAEDVARRRTVAAGFRQAGGFLLAACLSLVATLLVCGDARADDIAASVRLEQRGQQDPVGGPAEPQARRVVVFVIDRSESMVLLEKGGMRESPNNRQRWSRTRETIESELGRLLQSEPGVEVRLEYFADDYPFGGVVARTLSGQEDLDFLLERIPRKPERHNGIKKTAYHRAVRRSLESVLLQDQREGPLESARVAVLSDGEDTANDGERRPSEEAIRRFEARFGKGTVDVYTVGEEAENASKKGKYGILAAQAIAKLRIPPPPPPKRTVELVAGTEAPVQPLAKSGAVSMRIRFDATGGAEIPKQVSLSLAGPTPFRLEGASVVAVRDGEARCSLSLPPGTDVDAGVSFTVRVEAESPASSPVVFVGRPEFSVRFAAAKTRPPAQWKVSVPEHVRVKDRFTVTVDPGTVQGQPEWRFAKASQVERSTGFSVTRALDVGGSWQVTVNARSEGGKELSGPVSVIEVVDSSFSLGVPGQTSQASIKRGQQSLEVELRPLGPSEATYRAWILGRPDLPEVSVPAAKGGSVRFAVPTGTLDVGVQTLVVAARSKVGSHEWREELPFGVTIVPGITVNDPSVFAEHMKEAEIEVVVSGDVGGSVALWVKDRRIAQRNVGGKRDVVDFKFPVEEIVAGGVDFEVRPSNQAACPPARGRIVTRLADLSITLTAPGQNTEFNPTDPPVVRLSLGGEDFPLLRDATGLGIELCILQQDRKPSAEDRTLIASPPGFEVKLPAGLKRGNVDLWVRPKTGNPRAELFVREWTRVGTLQARGPELAIRKEGAAEPGRPVAFTLQGVKPEAVRGVRWTYRTDPQGRPVAERRTETTTDRFTPESWGNLTVGAEVTLKDGEVIPEVRLDVPVVGVSPTASPFLPSGPDVAADASEITLDPRLTGSFRSWKVVLPKGETVPGSVGGGPVTIPVAKLPETFELRVEVEAYPGDPKGSPPPFAVSGSLRVPQDSVVVGTESRPIEQGVATVAWDGEPPVITVNSGMASRFSEPELGGVGFRSIGTAAPGRITFSPSEGWNGGPATVTSRSLSDGSTRTVRVELVKTDLVPPVLLGNDRPLEARFDRELRFTIDPKQPGRGSRTGPFRYSIAFDDGPEKVIEFPHTIPALDGAVPKRMVRVFVTVPVPAAVDPSGSRRSCLAELVQTRPLPRLVVSGPDGPIKGSVRWDGLPPTVTVQWTPEAEDSRFYGGIRIGKDGKGFERLEGGTGTTGSFKPTRDVPSGSPVLTVELLYSGSGEVAAAADIPFDIRRPEPVAFELPAEFDGPIATAQPRSAKGSYLASRYEWQVVNDPGGQSGSDSGADSWQSFDPAQGVPEFEGGGSRRRIEIRQVFEVPLVLDANDGKSDGRVEEIVNAVTQWKPRDWVKTVGFWLLELIVTLALVWLLYLNSLFCASYSWSWEPSFGRAGRFKKGLILFRPAWNPIAKRVRIPLAASDGDEFLKANIRDKYFLISLLAGDSGKNGIYSKGMQLANLGVRPYGSRNEKGLIYVVQPNARSWYLVVRKQPVLITVLLWLLLVSVPVIAILVGLKCYNDRWFVV